jgi:Zn-dependent protease with chaperone function
MDFFERQEKARQGTKRLVLLFGAGVIALTLAVYLAVVLIFAGVGASKHPRYYDRAFGEARRNAAPEIWNPQLLLASAAGTLVVVLMGGLFKTSELSKGGRAVAAMLGGIPVNPGTADPDERKLLNIVEEMSIASGVPVPQVFVLPKEDGINAFAAGYSPSDAAIGVTRGAIRLLNRDELQGVIAHEYSHILNGDMRLNMRLIAWVFGILCLTIIGRILLRTRGRKNPMPVLGLALVIIGWIGVLFGQLIQAAVSRQREHLADASAVQFTRNPLGLASALKKIGGFAQGSRLETPQAAQASHMFFGNGMGSPFFGLMATHPPLEARIRALDPGFDGRFPAVAGAGPRMADALPEHMASAFSGLFGDEPASDWRSAPRPAPLPPVIAPHDIVSAVGSPRPAHIRYARELQSAIPEAVSAAARESSGATALVFALLLSGRDEVRAEQTRQISAAMGEGIASEAVRLFPAARGAALAARLPVVDLALPALRQMSARQFESFRAAIEKVIEADGEIDLFEYVLQKVTMRHLEPHFGLARKPVVQFYSLKGLAGDCETLLSGLAHIGGEDAAQSQQAFLAGAETLSYTAQARMDMVTPEHCGLDRMDAALNRLSQAVPQIKKNVLNACALTISRDGLIKEEEAELLRAVADTLDCPMPPLIPRTPDHA